MLGDNVAEWERSDRRRRPRPVGTGVRVDRCCLSAEGQRAAGWCPGLRPGLDVVSWAWASRGPRGVTHGLRSPVRGDGRQSRRFLAAC